MTQQLQCFTGEYYHVFSKSIAGFEILKYKEDNQRMLALLAHYQYEGVPKFSDFKRSKNINGISDANARFFLNNNEKLVKILAYCFMPTHIHLILQQMKNDGISFYMSNLLNGYSRYFNIKIGRKGPLWEGRFKRVRIETDEQLLHLTRYVHLNPVTANLVENPKAWTFSSYCEYINLKEDNNRLCQWEHVITIASQDYKDFVHDRIGYQRELERIKHLILK